MIEPAKPAQPAKPVTPEELGRRTGGYVQPAHPSANSGPLPGGALPTPPQGPLPATPPAPTAAPPSGPSYGPPGAPGGPVGAGGVPTGAEALGIDQATYQAVVGELGQATDPAAFKTQFQTLEEQRQLLARPEGVDPQGNYVLSKDQKSYYSQWMREAVKYASAPVEAGGLGYTQNQARMSAIVEARRRWPKVPVYAYTSQENLASFDAPDVSVGGTKVEVGPQAAARLDRAKVADLLTKPELKEALQAADEYAQGGGNSAVDFVNHVIDSEVARRTAKQANGVNDPDVLKRAQALGIDPGEDGRLSTDEIKLAKAQLDLQMSAMKDTDPALDQFKTVKKQMTAITSFIDASEKPKSDTELRKEVHDWFLENRDVYSVAAGLRQLY